MQPHFEIEDLHVTIGTREVLNGIHLTIPPGEVHLLVGPNGGGKTSLLMTIMGYSAYEITAGRIVFDGKEITASGIQERARWGIGMAHQRPPTVAGVRLMSVIDYIRGYRDNGNEELVHRMIDHCDLDDMLARGINSGLSGGEIKRSELLQLIAMAPRLALLDEPDSGVDMESIRLIGTMIHSLFRRGAEQTNTCSGLIVTHTTAVRDYLDVDRVHIMQSGRIVTSGPPAATLELIESEGFGVSA